MILLHEFEDEMITCTMCGFCRQVCPALEERGWESYAPRGLVSIGYGLLRRGLHPTKAMIDSVFACTTCGRCVAKCPPQTKIRDIVLATRAVLFQGKSTPKSVTKLLSNLARTGNIYGRTRNKLAQKHSAAVYFPGCNIRYRHPEILKSSITLLNRVGVNTVVMEGADCCGAPALLAGNLGQFHTIARANSSWIDTTRLIFSCPIGLQTMKEEYRETKGSASASHLTEVLSQAIGSIHFRETSETVTYHDPCYLARMLKVVDPPRSLLSSVPELRFVEMADSKENTRCCGSGAGITEQSTPTLSREIAATRIKQAREVGAERIITSCPYCLDQLRKVSDGLPVDEISVFLASRLQSPH